MSMLFFKILRFTFLFFSVVSFCQKSKLDNEIIKANKAVELKEYDKAIKIYEKIAKYNEFNADIQFNLATLYFLVGNKEKGCECAFSAITLKDQEAEKMVELNCRDFKNGQVKLLSQVDSPPMFLYEGNYFNLIENHEVSLLFLKVVKNKLRLSLKREVIIEFKINTKGSFLSKISGLDSFSSFNRNSEEIDMVRKRIERFLKFEMQYKPALFDGKPVEVFESFKFMLPQD